MIPGLRLFIIGGTLGIVTFGLYQSKDIDAFVHSLQPRAESMAYEQSHWEEGEEQAVQASHEPNMEQLTADIAEHAEKSKEAPIDAKVDRVWKAIPGYNGLEVDVEETLKLAKKQGTAEGIPYVYKEVPPAVGLDDLGAQPIYKGNPNKRMVALMINVAWGNEFIGPMLDILDRENVKATFFFDGSWLSKNVDTAKGIQQRGHELSNHAYSHKNMSTLGRQESINEIDKTQKLLKEQLGVDNPLFAPPSGDFNQQTVQIAHEMGLKTILWTLDTVDWMKPSSESIVRKVAARVEPGTMILMHPTESSSGALEGMIRVIKEKDLALGTVSQVISSNRVPSPNVSLEGNP